MLRCHVMLQSPPRDHAEAGIPLSLLAHAAFSRLPCPASLALFPVSPESPSLTNHVSVNSHLWVCFREDLTKTGNRGQGQDGH